jgi:hypothetical protein
VETALFGGTFPGTVVSFDTLEEYDREETQAIGMLDLDEAMAVTVGMALCQHRWQAANVK